MVSCSKDLVLITELNHFNMNTPYAMQLRLKFSQGSSLLSVSHTHTKKKHPEEDFQSFQMGKRLLRKRDLFWNKHREDLHGSSLLVPSGEGTVDAPERAWLQMDDIAVSARLFRQALL